MEETKCYCGHTTYCDCGPEIDAMEEYANQQKSYSEEDIINALHSVELKDNKDYSKIYCGMKEWFEQFKNK